MKSTKGKIAFTKEVKKIEQSVRKLKSALNKGPVLQGAQLTRIKKLLKAATDKIISADSAACW